MKRRPLFDSIATSIIDLGIMIQKCVDGTRERLTGCMDYQYTVSMDSNESEACGRCAMTSVVGTTQAEDESDDNPSEHDPFAGAHIEIDDSELRLASAPAVITGRVKHRLDELATRFVYGR